MDDEHWMRIALQSAQCACPSPNPPVGAAIVLNDRLLAQGYHERAGGPHAEIAALAEARGELSGATLYVTLEPCNHHGRTPPCTDAILAGGIGRVVIGCEDPNTRVEGGGAARLRRAGLEVRLGVLLDDSRSVVARWAHVQRTGLVHATIARQGSAEFTEFDAVWASTFGVLPGARSVVLSDPRLDFADALCATLEGQTLYVLCEHTASVRRVARLQEAGAIVIRTAFRGGQLADVREAMRALAAMGLVSVLVLDEHLGRRLVAEGLARGTRDRSLAATGSLQP
jgi:pyrimidine deaminase RibD-like protein